MLPNDKVEQLSLTRVMSLETFNSSTRVRVRVRIRVSVRVRVRVRVRLEF